MDLAVPAVAPRGESAGEGAGDGPATDGVDPGRDRPATETSRAAAPAGGDRP